MRAENGAPVDYFLPVGDGEVPMNRLIGLDVSMEFTGRINCISCGKLTKTSFGQGFCYSCLQTAPEASESVLQPELSKAHLGIARNKEFAEKHDLIDHFVYLALSPGLKVGVTRHHQVPVRWIDQGASSAIVLAKTPNRHIAGVIEVWLKQYYSDKTNWRDMLTNRQGPEIDLTQEKSKAFDMLTPELRKYFVDSDQITTITYPVARYPDKIISLSFDKSAVIEGKLTGIRGQYLILNGGNVLNIRKHSGYWLKLTELLK